MIKLKLLPFKFSNQHYIFTLHFISSHTQFGEAKVIRISKAEGIDKKNLPTTNFAKMGGKNPWLVENIEEFSFYCCPECDFRSRDRDHFKRHAMESHNKSKVFFIDLKPENKHLLEFETEPKDKYDEGMEKFGASEIIVKEESLSESKGEVNKNKAQTLKNGPDLELFDDYKPAEDNLKTIDSHKAEENVEELKNFDGENYQDFTEVETSDEEIIDNSRQLEMTDKELEQDLNIINDMESEAKVEPAQTFDENTFSFIEEKNNIIREEKKRERDSDIERERKKKKMRAILDMDDNNEEDTKDHSNLNLLINSTTCNKVSPADLRNLLSSKSKKQVLFDKKDKISLNSTNSKPSSKVNDEITLNSKIYRSINSSIIYRTSRHDAVHHHSLADRGANGGVGGEDIRVICMNPDRKVDVRGIYNH